MDRYVDVTAQLDALKGLDLRRVSKDELHQRLVKLLDGRTRQHICLGEKQVWIRARPCVGNKQFDNVSEITYRTEPTMQVAPMYRVALPFTRQGTQLRRYRNNLRLPAVQIRLLVNHKKPKGDDLMEVYDDAAFDELRLAMQSTADCSCIARERAT